MTDTKLGAIFKVDAATGNRSIFSQAGTRGSGPPLHYPMGIVQHDNALYVANNISLAIAADVNKTGYANLMRVDAATGGPGDLV